MSGARQAALIAGLLLSGSALAEPARPRLVEGEVSLTYVRAPHARGCPDEAAFRERAADSFGFHDPFVPEADATAHVRIEITRTDDDFLATVFAVDAAGSAISTSTERH